ncbi:MAG: hypothetical protein IPP45_02260 [Sphingomonadales bacterium]|nr:hypothetical protein [Sphingomonadales bacterium]
MLRPASTSISDRPATSLVTVKAEPALQTNGGYTAIPAACTIAICRTGIRRQAASLEDHIKAGENIGPVCLDAADVEVGCIGAGFQ